MRFVVNFGNANILKTLPYLCRRNWTLLSSHSLQTFKEIVLNVNKWDCQPIFVGIFPHKRLIFSADEKRIRIRIGFQYCQATTVLLKSCTGGQCSWYFFEKHQIKDTYICLWTDSCLQNH